MQIPFSLLTHTLLLLAISAPASAADEKLITVIEAPVKGAGSGVTVRGTLTRSTYRLDGRNEIPLLKVALNISNYTSATVQIGESLMLFQKAKTGDGYIGA